jgi:hypothetical protein
MSKKGMMLLMTQLKNLPYSYRLFKKVSQIHTSSGRPRLPLWNNVSVREVLSPGYLFAINYLSTPIGRVSIFIYNSDRYCKSREDNVLSRLAVHRDAFFACKRH